MAVESLPGAGLALAVHGELDLATAPQLAERLEGLEAEADGPVLVDLSSCSFVDSSGIAVLINAAKACADRRRPFTLVAPPESQPARVLTLCGIPERYAVVGSREEAAASEG